MFATPKSHYNLDDDSDSSPYSLSFSQRAIGNSICDLRLETASNVWLPYITKGNKYADHYKWFNELLYSIGVEVTWGEKTRSIPFKSKKSYEQRDAESPPTKTYVDVEPVATESPKGVFKFLLGWKRRQVASQIEDDFQRIADETTSAQNSNNSTNETNFYTASEQVEPTQSISNSPNYKQLLNDSEDMDLMLCSQRIEQEVQSRVEPVIQTAIASKGFSDLFSDDDGKFALL